MGAVQDSVRGGLLRPFRRLGLTVARQWPWPVSARLNSGRRMFVDLRSGIGRGIYATGEFDPAVFVPLRAALRPGGTFLDVGANVGFYSMLALDVVGPAGSVHAFEIDERPLRCLRRTVERERIGNLTVHETAVGWSDGSASVIQRDDSGHTGLATKADGPRIKMVRLDSWWRAAGVENVQAIKLDIEGAEFPALEGAKEMLKAMRPVIVCEAEGEMQGRFGYASADLLRLFGELRYSVRSLEGAWSRTLVAEPVSP